VNHPVLLVWFDKFVRRQCLPEKKHY